MLSIGNQSNACCLVAAGQGVSDLHRAGPAGIGDGALEVARRMQRGELEQRLLCEVVARD